MIGTNKIDLDQVGEVMLLEQCYLFNRLEEGDLVQLRKIVIVDVKGLRSLLDEAV